MRTTHILWWLRSLAVGAAVGFGVGLVVGGMLGRAFMRLVFLAREDTLGLETSMGAIIGDFTAAGTLFIAVFGAIFGLLLGLGYVLLRGLMPRRLWWRETAFTLAAGGLMLGLIVRLNPEDFEILPVTLSLILIAGSVLLTALPVPALVERFAPDREHSPGAGALVTLALGGVAIAAYATTAVVALYSR
jgi:hypothetical protein